MSYRKTVYYILTLALVVEILFFVPSCTNFDGKFCTILLNLNFLVEPLGFGLLSIIPVLIILLFTKQQVFTTWKKFAIPYIALSTLLLIFAGNSGGGFGFGSIIDSREGISIILSILFFVISIFLIAIKSWRLRDR